MFHGFKENYYYLKLQFIIFHYWIYLFYPILNRKSPTISMGLSLSKFFYMWIKTLFMYKQLPSQFSVFSFYHYNVAAC